MIEMENNLLSDEAVLNILRGIVGEMIEAGEVHASNIDKLPDEFKAEAMQVNTLLSIGSVFFFKALEKQDSEFARGVADIWLSEPVQLLVAIAFKDQIAAANASVEDGIAKLEEVVNSKETDDSSSGSDDK